MDLVKAALSRDVLRAVIAEDQVALAAFEKTNKADLRLARTSWLAALRASTDSRFMAALTAMQDRMWGRVKQELEHSTPPGVPLEARVYVCELSSGEAAFPPQKNGNGNGSHNE
jgi:hypothetical protein